MGPPEWIDRLEVILKQISQEPFAATLIALIVLTALISAITKIIECFFRLLSPIGDIIAFATSTLGTRRARALQIGRRTQFLKVLGSDLATIAKAEAWNDQHFTDMEAEVEIEGGYYTGMVAKILRRRSFGKRKEPSLVRAIDRSSEKCLLLTGDPGAGKSVALRHLACQVIERSIASNNEYASVPLYVNLRELDAVAPDTISTDFVKQFVIDNVRRGDADTAEYLRENWDLFREKGSWLLLFDSFDEIPAVMHAAAKEDIVFRYSEAIRLFMDGLGACRGVLASREYKHPTNSAWPKLRILPLDEPRQIELVSRTFLTEENKSEVLRSLSKSKSATFTNPLFLSLLCRYVKKNNSGPKDEHELLFSHVDHLSRRDSSFVLGKWGLSNEDLLQGAAKLARLFATSDSLGLSPTIAQIQKAADASDLLDQTSVEPLIEALTSVKIGRTDVQSSDTSVRRFAFSHRRYQECLVAVHLMSEIDSLDIEGMLVDAQVREYVVAMLQIGSSSVVHKLVVAASRLVNRQVSRVRYKVKRVLGRTLSIAPWNDAELEHVLELFLDAQRYHPDGSWAELGESIEKLLGRAWRTDDLFDRRKVLQFCSLGDSALLERRLEFAMSSGVSALEEAGLNACRFLVNPNDDLASWVRRNVVSRIVTSVKVFETLRWEAMAVSLPEAYQLEVPLRRAKQLMSSGIGSRVNLVIQSVTTYVIRLMPFSKSPTLLNGPEKLKVFSSLSFVSMLYVALALLAGGISTIAGTDVRAAHAAGLVIIVFSVPFFAGSVRLLLIDIPQPLTLQLLIRRAMKSFRRLRNAIFVMAITTSLFLLPGLTLLLAVNIFSIFDYTRPSEVILAGSLITYGLIGSLGYLLESASAYKSRRKVESVIASSRDLTAALKKANSGEELAYICMKYDRRGSDDTETRSAITYLSAALAVIDSGPNSGSQLRWLKTINRSKIRRAVSFLFEPSK